MLKWNDQHQCKEVSIEVTNACKLNCAHCSSEAGKKFTRELTLSQIMDIISVSKAYLGTEVISLSGGEPLLREDLWRIVNHIKSLDMSILLYTCGNYPSEQSRGFAGLVSLADIDYLDDTVARNVGSILDGANNKNLRVIFSIEGLELTHDALTRYSGSFKNMVKSVEFFRNICNCEGHFTPNRFNYKFLEDVYRECIEIGIKKLSLLRMVPQGRCALNTRELVPNKDEMNNIIWSAHLLKEKIEREGRSTSLRVGDPLNWEFFFNNNIIRRCCAGIDRMLIRSNGEVQFCAALKHSPEYNFGNFNDQELEWMWNKSPLVKKLRKLHYDEIKVEGGCTDCEFYNNCHGGCTSQRIATYGDMLVGPDPLCTKELFMGDEK